MYIAVAGNIGSGKTTLTRMLSKYYSWTPKFESVDFNPYLADYYSDISRWSFNMEVYFLKERFKDILDIANQKENIIQDRTIYEGVYVFASNNHEMGNMSDRDYETYMDLFESLLSVIKLPDLMIYLRASIPHLVENIEKRARDYEQVMKLDYLKKLNEKYEDFIFNKYSGRKIIVDADSLDFEHSTKDFSEIIEQIDSTLFGLFK